MKVISALLELIKNGFDIEQIEEDRFEVTNNGKFEFLEEEEQFIVDGEELIEIYKTYIKN